MTAAAPTRPRTGLFTKIAYGFGSVAYGVKDNGFQALLLLFYNQVLGLSPYLGGLAILLALAPPLWRRQMDARARAWRA